MEERLTRYICSRLLHSNAAIQIVNISNGKAWHLSPLYGKTNRCSVNTRTLGSVVSPYGRCPPDPRAHGAYTVILPDLEPFQVLCDTKIAGPGWTVIARRTSEDLNFFRNSTEYKRGFGLVTGDFFIGLDKLHAITKSQRQELYVHLEAFMGHIRHAQYSEFPIESDIGAFRISKLGTYTGTAGDSLVLAKNQTFSTNGRDNDGNRTHGALVAQRLSEQPIQPMLKFMQMMVRPR